MFKKLVQGQFIPSVYFAVDLKVIIIQQNSYRGRLQCEIPELDSIRMSNTTI